MCFCFGGVYFWCVYYYFFQMQWWKDFQLDIMGNFIVDEEISFLRRDYVWIVVVVYLNGNGIFFVFFNVVGNINLKIDVVFNMVFCQMVIYIYLCVDVCIFKIEDVVSLVIIV